MPNFALLNYYSPYFYAEGEQKSSDSWQEENWLRYPFLYFFIKLNLLDASHALLSRFLNRTGTDFYKNNFLVLALETRFFLKWVIFVGITTGNKDHEKENWRQHQGYEEFYACEKSWLHAERNRS